MLKKSVGIFNKYIYFYFRFKQEEYMHQPVRKVIVTGVILLAVLVLLLFSVRNIFIRQYIGHKLEKLEKTRRISIHYDDIKMIGLSGIQIEGVSVIPQDADTFLQSHSFRMKLDRSSLLLLKISVKSIEADRVNISFIKKDTTSNFDFLYHTATSQNVTVRTETEQNFARKTSRLFSLLFKLLPDNATLRNLSVSYLNKGDELVIEIPSLVIKDSRFTTGIRSTENGVQSEWVCEGVLQEREKKIEAWLHAKENTKITLPFLNYRWGTQIQFDTLAFKLEELLQKNDLHAVRGQANISGLTLHQRRISPDTVLLDRGTIDCQVNIGKNYLELDSVSRINFNQLDFHPYLKAEKDSDWHITASVNKQDFPANDLFVSLPKGLFNNLEGLKANGTLSYHFLLDVDFSSLDSLQLESSLTAHNFQITQYGNTDLHKMNEPFEYTVYENDEPVRTFEVGEGNPSFRPFLMVSRYLPLAIMQSEDAGFFYHNGFIPSAIRESLILDLKERRFARGGSTLSMQLVKNVFLSRNKTIARKLEEILIVWLIESNHLTSKERMFEVYLNIVEWGPFVYGAAEASHFYFAKEPSALSLGECIFLASIIPKPKHVRYCFDGLQLKPYYTEFYQVILSRLVDRGLITPEEAEGVRPEDLKITGPAKYYLAGPDNDQTN